MLGIQDILPARKLHKATQKLELIVVVLVNTTVLLLDLGNRVSATLTLVKVARLKEPGIVKEVSV